MGKGIGRKTDGIPQFTKDNYQTLLKAIAANRTCLVRTTRSNNGEEVTLICVINPAEDDPESIEMVPVAEMIEGNPYELFDPPGLDEEG